MSVLGQLLLSLYPSPQKKDNKKNPYFPLTLKYYLTECLQDGVRLQDLLLHPGGYVGGDRA